MCGKLIKNKSGEKMHMDKKRAAGNFLRDNGMVCETPAETLCERFREEMARGLRREPSTLMMLPSYLVLGDGLPADGRAAALDMGGTNLRSALVTVERGKARVELDVTDRTPGSVAPVTRAEMLEALSRRLDALPAGVPLGFCFSFPAEITPELDGRVLLFDKEVRVTGGVGMLLGHELSRYMADTGRTPPAACAVVNDTAAALLSGFLTENPAEYDGIVGFILGTGLNICYPEQTERIAGISAPAGRRMIVNLEAGGCGIFPRGEFDLALDAASEETGRNPLEKMTSGAYLGRLMALTLEGAARAGLLSPDCAAAVQSLGELHLRDAGALLDGQNDGLLRRLRAGAEDAEAIETILGGLTARAAGYIAAALTAVVVTGDMGRSPERPAAIMTEGSTILRFARYNRELQRELRALCTGVYGRYWRLASGPDANLKGAAAAVLMQQACN